MRVVQKNVSVDCENHKIHVLTTIVSDEYRPYRIEVEQVARRTALSRRVDDHDPLDALGVVVGEDGLVSCNL